MTIPRSPKLIPLGTAVDAIVVLFANLGPRAQDEALERLNDARASREARDDSEMARYIRSLQTVAGHLGHSPTVGEYKDVSAQLLADGDDVETFSRLYRFFGQSWPRAVEALTLADVTTPLRIQARFRYRRVGKVWRFSDDALREAVAQAVEHYGRVPLVAEFEWWRQEQMELAEAQGDLGVMLPTASPYRRRWGTWEAALLHFGYTRAQVEQRLETF